MKNYLLLSRETKINITISGDKGPKVIFYIIQH